MATYKSLKGQPIQVLTADPPAPVEGQVWVVAAPGTASVMKGYALGTGAWATGGNLNTARQQMGGAGASQTSAIAFGGDSGSDQLVINELYNGTAWSESSGDLASKRSNNAGLIWSKWSWNNNFRINFWWTT